jgi:predicted protein tyrosine phosphatase
MKMTWIEDGLLAASGIPLDAPDIQSLHDQGIRAILSLTEQPLTSFKKLPPALFDELNITYLHVPIPDGYPPSIPQAGDILEFIDQRKSEARAVFVHCHAGLGRTGTVLHLYYLAQGLTLAEAREQVKLHRPQSTLLSDRQKAFLLDVARLGKDTLLQQAREIGDRARRSHSHNPLVRRIMKKLHDSDK